nr:uncharacterized protein LOC109623019 [Aedes albopictus]
MTTDKKCAKCSSEHATFVCEEFKKMNLKERRGFAQEANLCFNCLRASHSAKSCLSKSVCRTQGCGQRHHTLLCPNVSKENDAPADNTVKSESPNSSAMEEQIVTSLTVAVDTKPSIPVFPTAVVQVRKDDGTFGRVRVLIDSGAQASMVTEDCVRKLGLVRRNGKVVVTGIGQQAAGTTRGVVTLHLASRFNENVVITTSAYVLGKLTSTLPSQRFNIGNMKLLENVKEMADPTFNKPGPIDVILGADVFLALLEGGQVKDESGQTVAQSTVFGWIAAGRYDEAEVMQGNHAIVSLHTEMDLNRTLQQFWEYEEIFKPPPFTPSETKVIEHFDSTTQRDATGRFIVKLPFDDSKPALGANNEEEAACIKQEISDILSKSGFELRKWASSCPNLVQDDSPASVPVKLSDEADAVKALGIHWYPNDGQFGFKVNLPINAINTKRQMISDASKLFDPFGWLAPVIVKIKILYQYLWLYDVNWDDPLPTAIESEWVEIKQQLRQLETIRIPRFVTHNRGKLQLHGFSDSSEQAYAAVVYSRCIDDEGNITVLLVAAKSRVAPIKQVSLPRLELNGALLLTELMKKVSEALPNLEIEHFAWTDSTIVLQWLSSHPRSWKTYVANRTSAILEFLPRDRWRHVNSESNPADCASRGISPSELVHHKLWFHGPEWLSADESEWPSNAVQPVLSDELPEARNMKIMHTTETSITPLRDNYLVEQQLLERRSRFNLIVRSLACVNRFVHNIKSRTEQRHTGQLIPSEIHQAKLQLLRAAQHEVFAPEIKILRSVQIWSRWKDEYLASLQPRTKWRSVHPNISVGQLVLVKNDNAPPTQWELARVQEVHPDVSGVVRTVTLRRGTTVYQRPIHKLCVLPVN